MRRLGCIFEEKYIVGGEYNQLRELPKDEMKQQLINLLLPVEQILNYTFKDKNLLLESFTSRNFMEAFQTGSCYEKLEVLGDSILDYIANSNLIKFTMFEKYNVDERLSQKYVTAEDF